jgi:adenylate cyclase
MGKEIERKFLVKGDVWRSLAEGTAYRQGYLNNDKERTVRIRTIGAKAFLTIKGLTVGATHSEYEYEIAGLTWEIDEFFGENAGLIVAEVELESEGQIFEKPEWVGEEVTADPRYFNSNLIKHPYTKW